jgi:GTPase SAR1 family protein
MLIGNKNSGKSLFCKKILNNKEEIKETQFLEIKKKVVEINNEKILLELWDSNEQFINSALINIYYKLANAFIIIVDTNSDFNFIIKQTNLIKSIQKNAQILFICNNKYNNNDLFNIEQYKEFIYKDKNFFNLMNLHEISIDNNVIQNFLLKLI